MWKKYSQSVTPVLRYAGFILPAALTVMALAAGARAQSLSVEDLVSAVVRIKTSIDPEGRTVRNLGSERQGTGIVIAGDGLILTIGYLMVEAHSAEVVANDGRTVPANVVGYDYETGFGLLRATEPLGVRPMALGKSADIKQGDKVLVAAAGGVDMIGAAHVAAKREFAGYWEYLLDEAIFTSPPHPAWSGAALIDREGALVGIGSLIVGDATGKGDNVIGNMFVPIDRLPPILAALVADGRVTGPAKPWLGLHTEEAAGQLTVRRVVPDGPAEKAGIQPGDAIVSIGGETPKTLADFYRKIWAQGRAGVTVPLDVLRGGERRRIELKSMNRLDHLKMNSTF
ncbi:MAG: S1C family serine protease [Hyphomicrobiaceae bacterium]